jgi:hypothetical protein
MTTMSALSRLQPQRFNNNASCMLTWLIIHGKRQRQLSLKVSEPNFTQSASVPGSGLGGGNHPSSHSSVTLVGSWRRQSSVRRKKERRSTVHSFTPKDRNTEYDTDELNLFIRLSTDVPNPIGFCLLKCHTLLNCLSFEPSFVGTV